MSKNHCKDRRGAMHKDNSNWEVTIRPTRDGRGFRLDMSAQPADRRMVEFLSERIGETLATLDRP
jgi:hypothetical protein